MARFPELRPDELDAAQRRVAGAIAAGPRGALFGPFPPLLHSPGLADRVQALGAYLRFESALPEALRELAVLVTARRWTAQFEWHAHSRLALKAGVRPEVVDAIARGLRPDALAPAEAAVYDFARELHEARRVSDATFERASAHLGRRGAMDLIGLCGYYALIAMVLNVAEVPAPDGAPPLDGGAAR